LAWGTIALLALTVGAAFLLVGAGWASVKDVLSLLQPIIPAETGLAGAAVAFYFGGRERS
jgi:hypothetical protein